MSRKGINILILGKTGVGKSSFCNYIFGKDVFSVGRGKPVTQWGDQFKEYSIEYNKTNLNLYDSVGIETNNFNEWKTRLDSFLSERSANKNNNVLEWMHGVFYLINAASARIEKIEQDLVVHLNKNHSNITFNVVLTNADVASPDKVLGIEQILNEVKKNSSVSFNITKVCSVNIKTRAGIKERFGKDETLDIFLNSLDKSIRSSILKHAINRYIYSFNRLKKEGLDVIGNSDLGVFNFIKGFYKEGEDFKPEKLFNVDFDVVSKVHEENELYFEELDSFLSAFEFEHEDTTREVFDILIEKIERDTQSSLDEYEKKLDKMFADVEDAFATGSFLDKVKQGAKVARFTFNLKKSFKEVIEDTLNPIITYLKNELNKI